MTFWLFPATFLFEYGSCLSLLRHWWIRPSFALDGLEQRLHMRGGPVLPKGTRASFSFHCSLWRHSINRLYRLERKNRRSHGGGFLANLQATQESAKEKMTAVGYGRMLFESLTKRLPGGACSRMSAAYLLCRADWFLSGFALTWKAKDTKYNRLSFQLVPSEPAIDAIGFGLLPTPREGSFEKYETRAKRKGHAVAISYLETYLDYLGIEYSPRVAGAMMGFPKDWTVSPFARGEREALPHTETL